MYAYAQAVWMCCLLASVDWRAGRHPLAATPPVKLDDSTLTLPLTLTLTLTLTRFDWIHPGVVPWRCPLAHS